MPQPLTVILDFDGTITLKDVGYFVTLNFARESISEASEAFERGEISIRELATVELNSLREKDHPAMRKAAVETAEIRRGFPEFVQFCRDNSIPVEVASSGMKFYIDALLGNLEASHLPVAAPVLAFDERGHGKVAFEEGIIDCGMTPMCKCERVWRQRRLGRTVLFVGDGSSDHCAAHQADYVMARDSLARYCERANLNFTPFEDFFEVQETVARLAGVETKSLRPDTE